MSTDFVKRDFSGTRRSSFHCARSHIRSASRAALAALGFSLVACSPRLVFQVVNSTPREIVIQSTTQALTLGPGSSVVLGPNDFHRALYEAAGKRWRYASPTEDGGTYVHLRRYGEKLAGGETDSSCMSERMAGSSLPIIERGPS